MNENIIEFLRGDSIATITVVSNTRLNGRVRKLAVEKPDECQIVSENEDGSLVAHIPVSWIKLNPKRELTEERAETLRNQLKIFRDSQ